MPGGEFYEEYLQIENGVGMWASFQEEFEDALSDAEFEGTRTVSMVTGMAALPLIEECARKAMEKFSGLTCHVYGIQNEFFGENITVTGLLTGNDILGQIQGNPLGDTLLLPATTLRREGDLFLDDVSLEQFEQAEFDFSEIDFMGQGFADEVFRVFKAHHPEVEIIPINACPRVLGMIKHVQRP